MSRFSHVSLLIELDFEWWPPGTAAYLHTANYFPRRSRTLVHESLHYWQQLTHGYLLELAQEDWRQMLTWEQGGPAALGPLRDQYRRPEGRHQFSVHDLCESVARFWEVFYVGPKVVLRDAVTEARRQNLNGAVPSDLKDLAARDRVDSETVATAMDLSGSYAIPFAVVQELVGDRDGLVVFPLVAHFALKTKRPVHFFERFVDDLAPVIAARAEELGGTIVWTQDLAIEFYRLVSRRCEEIVRGAGEEGLLHAPALFRDSSLQESPVYLWSFRRRQSYGLTTEALDTIDLAVCLPAFSDFRKLLAVSLAPPCVRFRDRQTVGLARQNAAARVGGTADDVSAADDAMTECLSLQERWESFQDGLRRH